jgi:hypothetical protein
MDNLPDIASYFTPELVARFAEVQQSRSNFQIEKFVVGSQATPEMQYYQCLLELQSLYYKIKTISLEVKKAEIEIVRKRATGDEIDEIEAQITEIGLQQTRVVAVGAFRELDMLLKLLNTFPAYTREQIEANQPEYWNIRLNKQIELEKVGGSPSIASNLDSLISTGVIKYELPSEPNTSPHLE